MEKVITVAFPELQQDIARFSIKIKARHVYWKLMRSGKRNLAEKVAVKYNVDIKTPDAVTAFFIACNAIDKTKFNKQNNL